MARDSINQKKRPTRRLEASALRRQAILSAGLDVFATEGFAAARLDDVAEKAGVAKGTIYLFFDDKEHLFEQIVKGAVAPVLEQMQGIASQASLPLEQFLSALFDVFRREVLGTKRREIARLVLTEGSRFPRIAQYYHREVISKMLMLVRDVARRAHARGELPSDALVRFPHLLFAPMVMSLMWETLFAKYEPLDVKALLSAHGGVLIGTPGQHRGRK